MLLETLDLFFRETAPLAKGERLVVAFSGGPDSTALLAAATRLGRQRGFGVTAAHLDHRLDPDSRRRARRATAIAESIGVELRLERLVPDHEIRPPRGLEDWAREARYDFLERCRVDAGGRYIATAHHRDDQIETVLLRLLLGSGIEGLGSIAPLRGSVVRPLLAIGRAQIRGRLATYGLEPIEDPTNRDLARPRNLVRERIAPHLLAEDAQLGARLVSTATSARRLSRSIEPRLRQHLRVTRRHGDTSLDLPRFRDLAPALRPFALSLLHRSAGLPYPAGAAARRELDRQLSRGEEIGCDCGLGWAWQGRRGRLTLSLRNTLQPPFAYTLRVPGGVAIPELGLRVSVGLEPVEAWMFEGHPRRAALMLPVEDGDRLMVRNRRPGDRIRPLGCSYERRLKEVLIDRGIPREQRDRLPLLCLDDRIAWVPGMTIDDAFRLTGETHAWIAAIEDLQDI